MSKVINFPTFEDRIKNQNQPQESRMIFDIELFLKENNWKISFYGNEHIQEMAAIVDYDENSIVSNIPSAFYCATFMSRVMMCYMSGIQGKYVYQFKDGERSPEGHHFKHLVSEVYEVSHETK